MTATLPEPPQQYSFDCPACHSMLSIPVALEGVVGPCPYCNATLTAPPLIQSTEYAAYYYAYQQAMAEQAYTPSEQRWTPESEVILESAPTWETEQIATQTVSHPASDHPSWDQMPGRPASMDLPAFQVPVAQQPSPNNSANPPKHRRPSWAKIGLGAGLVGLAAGAYFTLKPNPQPVSAYQPPVHVPLTPAQAAQFTADQQKDAPPVSQPTPPSPPDVAPLPAAPGAETPSASPEIDAAPKALPTAPQEVPPVPKIIPEDSPSVKATAPEAANLTSPELEQPSLLAEPRAALKSFLAAVNWRERAKFTQHAQELQREMKEYYADHADSAIQADSIDYLTSQPTPDGKSRFHLFQVECGEGYGFPVSVESMDGGFKVDWRSFVEFKDLQLPNYFKKFSSEPATFHAVLHRSHYFGTDVPDQENKICFAIEPPVTGYTNFVWVDKSSLEIISKLGERAEFGFISYPVVSLRWVKEKDGAAYVMLYDVVADNWRTDTTLPKATPVR